MKEPTDFCSHLVLDGGMQTLQRALITRSDRSLVLLLRLQLGAQVRMSRAELREQVHLEPARLVLEVHRVLLEARLVVLEAQDDLVVELVVQPPAVVLPDRVGARRLLLQLELRLHRLALLLLLGG